MRTRILLVDYAGDDAVSKKEKETEIVCSEINLTAFAFLLLCSSSILWQKPSMAFTAGKNVISQQQGHVII